MFLLFIQLAFADEEKVVYQKSLEIDFEALDIEGEIVKPTGLFMSEMGTPKFNPLIELRYDWDKEMNDSVREIK